MRDGHHRLGAFKEQFWGLPDEAKAEIGQALKEQFGFLFDQLDVGDAMQLVEAHVQPMDIHKPPADFGLGGEIEISEDPED